jgi:hypothetical protein
MMAAWKSSSLIALALGLLAGLGCAEPAPQSAVDSRAALEPAPPKDVVPTPVMDEVDWKEALASERIDAARLNDTQRDVVSRSTVPVLLPDDDAYLKIAILTAGQAWYAASMPLEGRTVVVGGTRQAFEVPGLSDQQKEPMLNPHAYEITRTKGIVSLSFKAFGAAYMIDVECAAPMDDLRCTEDKYILSLAENLAIVAGGGNE